MLPYETIIKNPLNYNPAELINMERYVCFDNTAECSAQASLNNCDHNMEYDNEILTYHQINIDSEEHNEDASLANKECKVMVASEGIPECTVFDSWTNVETFLEEYERRNGFTVIKYRVDKNKARVNCSWHINLSYGEAGTLISITIFVNEHNHNINFDTQEFGNKYCILTEDALREVEIMTKYVCLSITAQEIKSNCTLIELADCLNQQLKAETQWNRFHLYKDSTTFPTVSTPGHALFPAVTKNIDKYLTDIINNRIKDEMAESLFLTANQIVITSYKLNFEQEIDEETSCEFFEDNYDACQITLQSIIDEVENEKIKEIWKISDIHSEKRHCIHFIVILNPISFLCLCLMTISRGLIYSYQENKMYEDENIIFNHEKGIVNEVCYSKEVLPIRQASTVSLMAPTMKKTLQKKNQYGKIWGLAREATLLVMNTEDSEIIKILQSYIMKKKNEVNTCNNDTQNNKKGNNNAVNKNQAMSEEDQAILEREDQAILEEENQATLEENQAISEEENEAISKGENDNNSTDNEVTNIQVPQNVQNPLHIIGKE
ncbi:15151_t:CDS:2 [Cetraspora pellucida]|uniref:15151_t:CDS:1 n=1 Tax=Cetraspora pellucida TaxID=1433469 RepID=A0A9N9JJZ8_9GLOM|nr:15151_t:CDS:2 [Cetraspora pellucida]